MSVGNNTQYDYNFETSLINALKVRKDFENYIANMTMGELIVVELVKDGKEYHYWNDSRKLWISGQITKILSYFKRKLEENVLSDMKFITDKYESIFSENNIRTFAQYINHLKSSKCCEPGKTEKYYIKTYYDAWVSVLQPDMLDVHEKYTNAKKLLESTKQYERMMNFKEVFEMAISHPSVSDKKSNIEMRTKLDSIRYLLSLKGGKVVDLRTKIVRERVKEDYLTWELNYDYDGHRQDDPLIDDFLNKIMCYDQEKVKLLYRLLGYFITGETSEQKLYIFHGHVGANGKSTLKAMLEKLFMSDNNSTTSLYQEVKRSALFGRSKSPDAHDGNMDFLHKKPRCAVSEEMNKDDHLDVATIKTLTGDPTIKIRPLFQGNITETIYAKIIILTNHQPNFDTSDKALCRRLVYVPFNAHFVDNPTAPNQYPRDNDFIDKITSDQHISNLLSILIDEAHEYYKTKKIILPETINTEVNTYILMKDSVRNFIENAFVEDVKAPNLTTDQIYEAYLLFFRKEYGTTNVPKTKREVDVKMTEYKSDHKFKSSKTMYQGLRLLSEYVKTDQNAYMLSANSENYNE